MTNTTVILVSMSVVALVILYRSIRYVLPQLHRRSTGRSIIFQCALVGMLLVGLTSGWIGAKWHDKTAFSTKATTVPMSDTTTMHLPTPQVMGHTETHVDAENGQSTALTGQQIRQQEVESASVLHEAALEPTLLPNGTKRFTLTASVFPWHLYSGQTFMAWGYNHQVPGPLLRFRVGDRVEIVVHNKLPDDTTVHWHGMAVPNAMDGVPGVTQKPIPPNGTFVYKFTVTPQMLGTHWYHSHVNDDFQIDQGLQGPIIVDAKSAPTQSQTTVDALYQIGSFKIGGSEAENVFTMDGKPFPEDPQLTVKAGSRVRIRFINASAEETHVMHLHGYSFEVVALDGNPVSHPQVQNTVMLGPSQTADVEFTANNKGRWMLHCHLADHMMNPEDYMDDMGGLVTYVNVQ